MKNLFYQLVLLIFFAVAALLNTGCSSHKQMSHNYRYERHDDPVARYDDEQFSAREYSSDVNTLSASTGKKGAVISPKLLSVEKLKALQKKYGVSAQGEKMSKWQMFKKYREIKAELKRRKALAADKKAGTTPDKVTADQTVFDSEDMNSIRKISDTQNHRLDVNSTAGSNKMQEMSNRSLIILLVALVLLLALVGGTSSALGNVLSILLAVILIVLLVWILFMLLDAAGA
ncbi:MAG: hypothetical protein V4543_05625 [Bacteroidota bacterium]